MKFQLVAYVICTCIHTLDSTYLGKYPVMQVGTMHIAAIPGMYLVSIKIGIRAFILYITRHIKVVQCYAYNWACMGSMAITYNIGFVYI